MNASASKLYRFAVYGRSNSGKTCLLTALAMARVPHPERLSCAWLPDPPGITDPSEAAAYRRGREVIEACRNAMKRGQKPPPTPPDPLLPRFRFNFTAVTPRPRTYAVELIDYAGELIDPGTSAPQLASQLRRRIQAGQVDAILVLAEAPRPGRELAKLFEEFERLKQAFAMLRDEGAGSPVRRVPVALLLNKWDRRHPASAAASDRQRELSAFLNSQPPPPHADLINALCGAVADGCFRPFAVSAFGVARSGQVGNVEGTVVTDAELPPLSSPLPSFGLEDPFVWAAHARDALDVAALKQDAAALSYASVSHLLLNALAFWTPWGLCWRARGLTRRHAGGPDELPPVRAARRRALGIAWGRTLTAMVSIVLVLLLAVAGYDGLRWHQVESHLNRPERAPELATTDERWLEGYVTSPGYLRVLSRLWLSRAEAARLLEASRDRRESDLWANVEAAPDDLTKDGPAATYLNSLPNGKHTSEANQVRQRAADARKYRENQGHFDSVDRAFNDHSARGTAQPDELRRLDERLQEVPHPSHETAEQYAARKRLREAIGMALVAANGREFREKYQSLLGDGKVREAGSLLAAQPNPPKDLIADFPGKALARVDQDCQRYLADHRWRDAEDVTRQLSDDPAVVKLLAAEDIRQLEQWRRKIKEAEDRDLYEQLRRYKDLQRAQRYLDAAPLQTMKGPAQAYRDHLLKLQQELPLTLHLSKIEWGNAWDRDTDYAVTLNGRTLMEGKVHAANNSVCQDVDKADIKHKLSDGASLAISVKHRGIVKDTDYGSPSHECAVRQLDGVKLTLEGKDPHSFVYFTLDGVPPEPELPPYRED